MSFETSCPRRSFDAVAKRATSYVQGRQYAVENVAADATALTLTFTWRKKVGYKGVQSWLGQALGDEVPSYKFHATDVEATEGESVLSVSAAAPCGPPLAGGSECAAASTAELRTAPLPASQKRSPKEASLVEMPEGPRAKVPRHRTECVAASAAISVQPSELIPLSHSWLSVKAFELDRGAVVDTVTETKYLSLEKLGGGAFGITTRMVDERTGVRVVVKQLRMDKKTPGPPEDKDAATASWEFHHEVGLLVQLWHPHITRLLDVAVRPYRLVFTDAGEDLRARVRSKGPVCEGLAADIMLQVAEGLRYLHGRSIVHSDLKPDNIAIDSNEHVRILDLGSAIVALPGYRSRRPSADVQKHGLNYCTLYTRSPELLLGDANYGFPSDVWSVGCVWHFLLLDTFPFKGNSGISMIFEIFQRLGSPRGADLDYFAGLPLWSSQMPAFPGQPLTWSSQMPQWSWSLIECLLRLAPGARTTAIMLADQLCRGRGSRGGTSPAEVEAPEAVPASQRFTTDEGTSSAAAPAAQRLTADEGTSSAAAPVVQQHQGGNLANPDMCLWELDGVSKFVAGRGEFSLIQGVLPPDVLQWLRQDPYFSKTAKDAGWSFKKPKPGKRAAQNTRTENGRKVEVIGHLGGKDKRSGLTLNGIDASMPHTDRFRAFAGAFRMKNEGSLHSIQTSLRLSLRKLRPTARSLNGQHLLEEDIGDWCMQLGTIQIMATSKTGKNLRDPTHWDGGASTFHVGVTLWGRRALHFIVDRPDPIVMETFPGHVCAGCVCPSRHFVEHFPLEPGEETLHVEDVGDVTVVLLCRSKVFRKSRGTTKTGPNPRPVFAIVNKAIIKALSEARWSLPSLAECQALVDPEA